MLYREIIAVCSQIHTKHINTLCGQNEEFVLSLVVYKLPYLRGFRAFSSVVRQMPRYNSKDGAPQPALFPN